MKPVSVTYACGHVDGDDQARGTHSYSTGKCRVCDPPPQTSAAIHMFREGFYTELTGSDEKMYFSSKRQLREEADRRGMYSEYAHG